MKLKIHKNLTIVCSEAYFEHKVKKLSLKYVKMSPFRQQFIRTVYVKSKFYKKRGATFFYDLTRKLGPLDFTQYRSKSSSF